MRLKDRVAFITGAGRGIGKAIARRFAQEGAKVCLTDIDEAGVHASAEELEKEGLTVFATRVD
ncbi:SDR family NAD(P)-dependent oxidoreductase, partial [Polycladomyces subterraneus]